jgi:sortase A
VLRVAYGALLALGIAALGYAGYTLLDLYWFQRVETSKLEAARVIAEPPPVATVPVAIGGVIGEIEVPRIGLKAIVVQGDSEKLLRRSVGHLPGTPLPGEPGNIALAGHRDGLFRPLRNIQPGDAITLRTRDRQFEYQVEWTAIVPPTATQVIQPTSEPALTLVTCYPFYYVGAAPERFIVRARSISSPDSSGSEPAGPGKTGLPAFESASRHSSDSGSDSALP